MGISLSIFVNFACFSFSKKTKTKSQKNFVFEKNENKSTKSFVFAPKSENEIKEIKEISEINEINEISEINEINETSLNWNFFFWIDSVFKELHFVLDLVSCVCRHNFNLLLLSLP
jgi:hypothetical protein